MFFLDLLVSLKSSLFVQASTEGCKLGAAEKTEFEYLIGLFGNNFGHYGRSGLGSNKTNPLKIHCWVATKASHKCGNLELLQLNYIVSFSRVRQNTHAFNFYSKLNYSTFFLEQNYQWCSWLPLNHSERQKWMYSFRRSLIGLDSSPWFRGTETSFHKLSIGHKITMWKINLLNTFWKFSEPKTAR